MYIVLASDHAGFQRKEYIKKYLVNKGYLLEDLGTYSDQSVDYPDFIHPAALRVAQNGNFIGIIFCGSANGAAITANKHQQIRASVVWNVETAKLAKQHNNANIISIPACFVDDQNTVLIVESYLSEIFEGGRHERRINKIPLN